MVARVSVPCEDDHGSPPDELFHGEVLTSFIAALVATKKRIAMTQTRGNEVAQLLACRSGVKPLFKRDYCLSCAVKQVKEGIEQIILSWAFWPGSLKV
jgi:hypothetical protein